jgi:site-specific recombinase XerD
MERYIQDNAVTREKGSLTVYKSVKNHLSDYQKAIKQNITFDSIDYAFFQSFQSYLIETKKLNNTTVAKQLSTIKTFLNYARKYGYAVSDKYKHFKIKRESLEVVALTQDEFESLYNLNLKNNKKLDQVRDVFCFSCVTGLRYSDLQQLKREHINRDEIVMTIKKTKEILSVPLNGYSRQILSKYKDAHKPLPVISNQKLNEYLKDLCENAKINTPTEIVRFKGVERQVDVYPKHELISVHVGRKTFVTLSLEKGMSAEEVMSITGHKDYKSFKRYVKVTEQRKKVVMLNAWGDVKKQISKRISLAS